MLHPLGCFGGLSTKKDSFNKKYTGKQALSELLTDSKRDTDEESREADDDHLEFMDGEINGDPIRHLCGYELKDTIGRGMSGKVKAGYCPDNGTYVALKIIDRKHLSKKLLHMVDAEVTALQSLQHPNILKLFMVKQVQYPRKCGLTHEVTCLVLEYARGGQVMDLMIQGAIPEDICRTYFYQLCDALAYCHSKNIYHRDIKPENILLNSDFQLKLADFGFAKSVDDPSELLRTECGTKAYIAPEVLDGRRYSGEKADVWSTGVVFFIMLSGNPPFQVARAEDWWYSQLQYNPDQFWKAHEKYFKGFTEEHKSLVNLILKSNPLERPTMKEILSDPWMQQRILDHDELKQAVLAFKPDMGARKLQAVKKKGFRKTIRRILKMIFPSLRNRE